MRNISEKLTPAALALSIGIEACAPSVPEPRQPEAVVVYIPFPSVGVSDDAEPERPGSHQMKNCGNQICGPLSVERILTVAPSQTAESIHQQIEEYRPRVTLQEETGSQVIAGCNLTSRARECSALQWEEHHRAILEKSESFLECTYNTQNNDDWRKCINKKIDEDGRAGAVRAYCHQLILQCVEAKF